MSVCVGVKPAVRAGSKTSAVRPRTNSGLVNPGPAGVARVRDHHLALSAAKWTIRIGLNQRLRKCTWPALARRL